MFVYRICKTTYSRDLSGTGAGLYGGRWNPQGMPMLYTSSSISLAILEYLAHNIHLLKNVKLTLIKLEIHKSSKIQRLNISELPSDWKEVAYIPRSTQMIGKRFLESKNHHGLQVPSVIVPNEYNILLNPSSTHHHKVKLIEEINEFKLDKRLTEL